MCIDYLDVVLCVCSGWEVMELGSVLFCCYVCVVWGSWLLVSVLLFVIFNVLGWWLDVFGWVWLVMWWCKLLFECVLLYVLLCGIFGELVGVLVVLCV